MKLEVRHLPLQYWDAPAVGFRVKVFGMFFATAIKIPQWLSDFIGKMGIIT